MEEYNSEVLESLSQHNKDLKSYFDNEEDINNITKKVFEILSKGFQEFIVFEKIMNLFIKNTILNIYIYFDENTKKYDDFKITARSRDKLYNLNKNPFIYFKAQSMNIHDLSINDERKLICQTIFLIILREKIPNKYNLIEDFLIDYPEFKYNSKNEINKLFNYSNWMNLLFYTIKPSGNKGFSIDIITRICEGKDVIYITGGGMTKDTRDRVLIFHREGNFEPFSKKRRDRNLTYHRDGNFEPASKKIK